MPDLSRYSFLTVLCILLAAAVEAGVVEEAAFRGYMQAPIERRYGPRVAIVIVSVAVSYTHLDVYKRQYYEYYRIVKRNTSVPRS